MNQETLILTLMERIKFLVDELPVIERTMQSCLATISSRNLNTIQLENLFKLYTELFQFYNNTVDTLRRTLLAISDTVSVEEKELLSGYRRLSDQKKQHIMQFIYG